MFSNKLAFTVLGAACITAAGAGSYLALRQNATSPARCSRHTCPQVRPPRPPRFALFRKPKPSSRRRQSRQAGGRQARRGAAGAQA